MTDLTTLEALKQALTWEGRMNSADQLAQQGADGLRESGAIRLAVQRERTATQRLLEGKRNDYS